MNNIVSRIICMEFEKVFKSYEKFKGGSDPDKGMLIEFDLKPDWDV